MFRGVRLLHNNPLYNTTQKTAHGKRIVLRGRSTSCSKASPLREQDCYEPHMVYTVFTVVTAVRRGQGFFLFFLVFLGRGV